jgi:hypothetical protein
MPSSLKSDSSDADESHRLFDRPLLIVLLVTAVAYYVTWAVIASLLGKGFATWLATPLWGIPFFIIARWDRMRKAGAHGWYDRISFPKLTRWILGFVICTILGIQTIGGLVLGSFLESARPDLAQAIPEDATTLQAIDRVTDDNQVLTICIVVGFLSYFAGGYVGAKLATRKEFPISHAAVGALIFSVTSYLIVGTLLWWDNIWETPTEEDMGFIFLATFMVTAISIFGAWVAVREHKKMLFSEMFPVKKETAVVAAEAIVESASNREAVPAVAVATSPVAIPAARVGDRRSAKGMAKKRRK